MDISNFPLLGALMTAAGTCLLLWLPTVTMHSQLKRALVHLVLGSLFAIALASQGEFLAATALVVMLAGTHVVFMLGAYWLERMERRDRLVRQGDFEAARFMPSQYLSS